MEYFSDPFLGYLELKQDLLYHKIPIEKIPYYIEEALQAGKILGQEFKGHSVKELLANHQITLKTETGDGNFFKVKFRAQFETDAKGMNQIFLYEQSIQELADANQLAEEEIEEIVLTHEFFHFLEDQRQLLIPEKLDSIETFRLGKFTRNAHVQRTSEIAANSFAKEVLGLANLPNYYDYIFLLKNDQLTETDLLEEYQEFKEIFRMDVKV